MKKNVGEMDAYLRITGGLMLLGHGIMDRSRFSVTMGAMKVAEGVTRFCPMLHMLGLSTKHGAEAKEELAKSQPLEVQPDHFFTE